MFENFRAVTKANSVLTSIQDNPSSILEGQPKKPKVAEGFASYPKVYQGCDTCKTEMLHYILGDVVTCLGCKSSYKLVSIDRCNLEK